MNAGWPALARRDRFGLDGVYDQFTAVELAAREEFLLETILAQTKPAMTGFQQTLFHKLEREILMNDNGERIINDARYYRYQFKSVRCTIGPHGS